MIHLSRTTLTPGDPLRDWLVAWDVAGYPEVNDPFGTLSGVGRNTQHSDRYAKTITLPPGLTSDAVTVRGNRVQIALPAPWRPAAVFSPTTLCVGSACFQEAIDQGYDLHLTPGTYYLTHPLLLARPVRVRGHGARLVRLPDLHYGHRMFIGGTGCTFEGVEFWGTGPDAILFHSDTPQTDLAFRGCVFREGGFGWPYRGCVFDDCHWDGGGIADSAPQGVYRNCTFRKNTTYHAFKAQGPCVAGMVMIDCEFDDVDRGPVHGCRHGDVTDNLYVGLKFRDIQRDQNGNEMVSAEGTGVGGAGASPFAFSRNLVIGTRARNCDGNLFLPWDVTACGNKVIDTVVEDGGGFWLPGMFDLEQSGNLFDQFELRNTTGVALGWLDNDGRRHGVNVLDNHFTNGAILGSRPSRLNQGRYALETYRRLGWLDLKACGPGNRFHNVTWVNHGLTATLDNKVVEVDSGQ